MISNSWRTEIKISVWWSSSWVKSEWSLIRVLRSYWESWFTKCVQISKKSILFSKIQTSRERWIFDKADWSFLHTIFWFAIHEIWIFLLTSEWDEIISWLVIEFTVLRSAWSSDHSTAWKDRFYRTINETRVSLISCLFSIFLRIFFFNSFCCTPAFI